MCFNALLFSPPAHGTSIPMIHLRYPSSPEVLNTFRRTRAISAAMAAAGQGETWESYRFCSLYGDDFKQCDPERLWI